MHERQRHELGEAAGALLQVAHTQQMARPVPVAVDVAEHDGRGAAQADADARSRMTSSHCAVLILSGHSTARTSSSRISAAVPGRLPSPAALSIARIVAQRQPERRRAVPDFQRRERMHMDSRRGLPSPRRRCRGRSRPYSRDGCRPACRPRSRHAAQASRVRGARSRRASDRRACSRRLRCAALREGAEPAADRCRRWCS